jgi:hypothetical protein
VIEKTNWPAKADQIFIEQPRSNRGASSGKQMRDHGDHGKNQKQMNQAAGHVKRREPEDPNHE